jgi:hypothetical protein
MGIIVPARMVQVAEQEGIEFPTGSALPAIGASQPVSVGSRRPCAGRCSGPLDDRGHLLSARGALPRAKVSAVVEYVEDQPDPGADGGAPTTSRRSSSGPPGCSRTVCHRAPPRAGQAAPANRGGRRARRLRGSEPVLPSLQAPARRHARATPGARRDRQKGVSFAEKCHSDCLTALMSGVGRRPSLEPTTGGYGEHPR